MDSKIAHDTRKGWGTLLYGCRISLVYRADGFCTHDIETNGKHNPVNHVWIRNYFCSDIGA